MPGLANRSNGHGAGKAGWDFHMGFVEPFKKFWRFSENPNLMGVAKKADLVIFMP